MLRYDQTMEPKVTAYVADDVHRYGGLAYNDQDWL